METAESKPFIDEHGFTPSELFSSSATSVSSSSTKSLQERLADAFDDSYDENSTSDDEYCILEENDQVLLKCLSWKVLSNKYHLLSFDFVSFIRLVQWLVCLYERFSGPVLFSYFVCSHSVFVIPIFSRKKRALTNAYIVYGF